MRGFVLLLIFLGSLNAFEISLRKNFSTKVIPKKVGVSVSINVEKKDLNSVLNKLSEYSDFIKSFKELSIEGGNFNTNPKYKYSKNKREKIGYRGNVYFKITSDNKEKINRLISMISAKNSQKDVDISISSMSWQVDLEDIEKKKDELRFKAILWADSYAKKLSSKLSSKCKVKSIDFDKTSYIKPPIVYSSVRSLPTPIKKKQVISLNPQIKFECK